MQILSASSCGRPIWAATVITGTRPAHDTRWSSSKRADAEVNLCDTCTGSAFLNWSDLMPEEHQSSQLKGHFPHINTPTPTRLVSGSRLSGLDRKFVGVMLLVVVRAGGRAWRGGRRGRWW